MSLIENWSVEAIDLSVTLTTATFMSAASEQAGE